MSSPVGSFSFDQCHLLALPPELRLEIYEHLFGYQNLLFLYWRELCEELRMMKGPRGIAILRTCRQLTPEAEPVFYDRTLILLDCSWALVSDWRKKTNRHFKGERVLKNIKHMELHITPNGKNVLAPGLSRGTIRFESLDYLKIRINMSYSGDPMRAQGDLKNVVLGLKAVKTSPDTTIELELRSYLGTEDSRKSTVARLNGLLLAFNA